MRHVAAWAKTGLNRYAIFLQYTSPVYVALLGYWLLHERPKRADWMAMPIVFAGLVLFFGDHLSLEGFYGNLRRSLNLRTGEITAVLHYATTSLNAHQASPAILFNLWHQHWGIENQGHWILDAVFAEDHSRARKAHLPEALSLMRKAVITLLRLLGQDSITRSRSSLSANVGNALSFVGIPLE